MDFYNNIPGPAWIGIGVLTGGGILGSLYYLDYRLAIIVTIGCVLLALVVAGFYMIRSWIQKRHSKAMVGDLQQQSNAAPSAISDVNKRAKLDGLRQKFASGLEKFGDTLNIYRFPWYLIVGEPGGGKSEAIRHCNVGFPPGMQDELQGVGGTINMNWWFTNQAVFLDTAGRLMFEEIKPGETNEWKEFLSLLKRNRPNCPINGLLLIIPADSLIRDNEAQLNEKAGKIAQQFDLIQRTLDIRFPVFVVVTKCDLLSGFREFFDDLTDAQSQQQMLGWSNPLERDQPFQTDLVTDHINTVVERIKKRRLSLLRDPVPQKGMERRIDEVDALYSFPQSLQLISPRLRTYLEKIFVAGPWSPKPLFLRGIYFASSMREGTALDQELAQVLGVPPEQINESRLWERERAYFLRDLFTEKIFKEAGLVTRATNTMKMLRARSIILWGSGIVLALALIGGSIYGYAQLENSIAAQTRYWKAASIDWQEGMWHPIVQAQDSDSLVSIYRGGEPVADVGGNVSLVDFHSRLRQMATTNFATSWVYRPMIWWFDLGATGKKANRLLAQSIVFEGSVISPLVKAARRRMLLEKLEQAPDAATLTDSERLSREAHGLAALIRVESDVLPPGGNAAVATDEVVKPLLTYATAQAHPADDNALASLGDDLNATFTKNPNAQWAPKWLALGSGSLDANKPIEAGLARLKSLAGGTAKTQVENLDRLKALRDDLSAFRQKEDGMDKTVPLAELSPQDKAKQMDGLMADLARIKQDIDEKVKEGASEHLFDGDDYSLTDSYQRLLGDSQKGAADSFDIVKNEVKDRLGDPDHLLYKQVDDRLSGILSGLKAEIESGFTDQERDDLKQLDPLLALYDPDRRVYEVRWSLYDTCRQETTVQDDNDALIGQNWEPLRQLTEKIGERRAELDDMKQKLPAPFTAACAYYLDRAVKERTEATVEAYVAQTASRFDALFNPPLVTAPTRKYMTRKDISAAETDIQIWTREIGADQLKSVDSPGRTKLMNFLLGLSKIDTDRISKAMDSKVEVGVLSYDSAPNKDGLNEWRYLEVGGRQYDLWHESPPMQVIGFDGRWSGKFQDFNDPTHIRTTSGSVTAADLVKNTGGRGGTASISVGDDNKTIYLDVHVEGEDPEGIPRQSKADILDTLR